MDHAWHHAQNSGGVNYGANLKLWDRLYGTNYDSNSAPNALGISTDLTLAQKLIWPF
jgi:sterol desaturase/sphingolipid hydroxylase (fatty acid hydroxylase superfamily)